jgi:hypothetical protein
MRAKDSADGLQLAAIAGSYVTLLGMDMAESDCQDLLGFAVFRKDNTTGGPGHYMQGQKAFRSSVKDTKQRTHSTRHHPIQSFWWEDYSAQPGHNYTYTVSALTGSVTNPDIAAKVSVTVENERPHNGVHDIYFNRGVAASQQYAERFGNKPPDKVDDQDSVWTWLSRGLYEALCEYVQDAGPDTALRIAAYELNYVPFLEKVAAAVAGGADVKIIYDGRKFDIYGKTEAALQATGLNKPEIAIPRRTTTSYISHNKFIVKLVNGSARSVWTGGTNFSDGGIFGHSNVAHVVEDEEIAAKYLTYWEALKADPTNAVLAPQVGSISSVPAGEPPCGTIAIFSPRSSLEAFGWYAPRTVAAKQALFMTFAFGMDTRFQDVYEYSSAPLRMALMETLVNRSLSKTNRVTTMARMWKLRRMRQNTFAVGSLVKDNALEGWLLEKLSGLNNHVKWVHNKFMLVDPLSADPIVVNGSANFSQASTERNDENMLVVRGDLRCADVFFTEFIRLHRHHAWRERQQWPNRVRRTGRRTAQAVAQAVRQPRQIQAVVRKDQDRWLVEPDDDRWPWWSPYFGDSANSARRSYYANPHVP